MTRYVVITGGDLYNKGAQAMTFSVVNEIARKYPDKKVVLFSSGDYKRSKAEKRNYNFEICDSSLKNLLYLTGNIFKSVSLLKRINKVDIQRLKEILENTDLIIDVSGYALSSVWKQSIQVTYLLRINLGRKYNIPVHVYPQSFGPFNYKFPNHFMMRSFIKKVMSHPEIIYAREHEGLGMLKEFGLDNVQLCEDMVLFGKSLELKNIYKNIPDLKTEKIKDNSVAILPNKKNFEHGNQENVTKTYEAMITELLKMGKHVYLISHSIEDLSICKKLKDCFPKEERLNLLKEEYSCIEYEKLVVQFDYLIASRYHSIVHAYKHGIPCIAVGWATKYYELLTNFKQEKYLFDVRDDIDVEKLNNTLYFINQNYDEESKVIENMITEKQKANSLALFE